MQTLEHDSASAPPDSTSESGAHQVWADLPESPDASQDAVDPIEPEVVTVLFAASESGQVQIEQAGRVRIEGELFRIEFEEGDVFLSHPRWSLVGSGETLFLAELDLRDEVRDMASHMLDVDPMSLDVSALEMRDYVLRFL